METHWDSSGMRAAYALMAIWLYSFVDGGGERAPRTPALRGLAGLSGRVAPGNLALYIATY
jgi:hypothetical protein